MQVGDQIRVKESVIVYHHPEHRSQPFDIKGLEGEIVGVLQEWQGRPVSANYPFIIQFAPKFRTHLNDFEIEVVVDEVASDAVVNDETSVET
jgi:Ferredoxin thioredoxin reductase variable alpha chain